MPKSSRQLEVDSVYFMNNFSKFIFAVSWQKKDWLGDLSKTPDHLYADYHGWEAILYRCNSDIPFLWVCLTICHKLGIKHKLARYQIYAIAQHFNIHEKLTREEIEEIVSKIE